MLITAGIPGIVSLLDIPYFEGLVDRMYIGIKPDKERCYLTEVLNYLSCHGKTLNNKTNIQGINLGGWSPLPQTRQVKKCIKNLDFISGSINYHIYVDEPFANSQLINMGVPFFKSGCD